ncbi:MAG: SpoIIE family protein phosphatase [Cyclonatronaceae bacterium]
MPETKPIILLVEDEPSMQMLFGFAIKKGGYKVIKAGNGKEALEILTTTTPTAIVSDIMMPEMDGFEFREALLENPELREIPFLFLTAFNSEDNILKGIGQEADDFIPKTEGAQVVLSKLNNAIRKRVQIQSKIVDEMDAASRSTGILLKPPAAPEVRGFGIEQVQKSHGEVPGGDFIDYLETPDGYLLVLADVMGKRWKAWVFAHAYAAYIRSSLRGMAAEVDAYNDAAQYLTPARLLNRLNAAIYTDERVETTLCALTLIKLIPGQPGITLSNALQYPLLCCRAESGAVEEVQVECSTLLGLSPKGQFEELFLPMLPGDVLVAFTDGLSEIYHSDDQTKGFEMLKVIIAELFAAGTLSASEILRTLLEKSGRQGPPDDASIILITKT